MHAIMMHMLHIIKKTWTALQDLIEQKNLQMHKKAELYPSDSKAIKVLKQLPNQLKLLLVFILSFYKSASANVYIETH